MHIQDDRPPPGSLRGDLRERRILYLLQRVWTYSITTKSDMARDCADEIAEAASRGFLTTKVANGAEAYGRLWKLTSSGLKYLEEIGWKIAEEEVTKYGEEYCQ